MVPGPPSWLETYLPPRGGNLQVVEQRRKTEEAALTDAVQEEGRGPVHPVPQAASHARVEAPFPGRRPAANPIEVGRLQPDPLQVVAEAIAPTPVRAVLVRVRVPGTSPAW